MNKIRIALSLVYSFCMGIISFTGANAQVSTLPFSNYIKQRSGLAHAYEAIVVRKQATVAFLGGSITYNPGWRDMVCADLKARFPGTRFHFIAAGIPSLGSLPHAFRLQQDVLDSGKVDLLFLEAAVNDQVNRTDSTIQVRALEGIVRHARASNPAMHIIMMSFADPDKTKLYDEGIVPVSVANHELVAAHYGLPSINLAKAVRDKLANHEFSWEKDFKDLHPSPFGQELYFTAIKTLLSAAFENKVAIGRKSTGLPAALDKASFTRGRYAATGDASHDAQWTLVKDWTPDDQLGTRPGFVHVPMLTATVPGASLTLEFKGTAVGMAIASGADAGIVTYRIDNGPEKQLDLFTEWSSSLHLPWYVIFDSGLKDTRHTLRLTVSPEKNPSSNGTACRIAHFLIN